MISWPHRILVCVTTLAALCFAVRADNTPAQGAAGYNPVTVLQATWVDRLRPDPSHVGSMWRYWETWQSEVIKLDGPATMASTGLPPATQPAQTVRADAIRPMRVATVAGGKAATCARTACGCWNPTQHGASRARPLRLPAGRTRTSTTAPGTAMKPPLGEGYRSLYLVRLRGRFQVTDPAKVTGLSLSLGFRGGTVVYLERRRGLCASTFPRAGSVLIPSPSRIPRTCTSPAPAP